MILCLNFQLNIQYLCISQIIVAQTRAVYTFVIPNRKIMLNVNNTTKMRKVYTLYYSHYFGRVIYIFRLIKILIRGGEDKDDNSY